MMATQKHGLYFPEFTDIPGSATLTAGDELHKALQAFKMSQERYEDAERTFTAALERNERPSRMRLELLENEYHSAAIFAANVALGRMTR
jgi:hypothetical protein